MFIYIQNLIINLSPALIPLMMLPLSFLQSWHCLVMCSSFQLNKSKPNQNLFLKGRALSYTFSGGIFGYLGQELASKLEYELVGFFAFSVFIFLTLILFIIWLGYFETRKNSESCHVHNSKVESKSSFTQGLMMSFIPCPLLFQVFSLSALTGSVWGGLLTGMAHAVSTTPTLWWGQNYIQKLFKFKKLTLILKISLGAILILNLFYFSAKWIYPNDEDIKTKLLFCL